MTENIPKLKYILNPTPDVHIRVRIEENDVGTSIEPLSTYDSGVVFISDNDVDSGSSSLSKKVDLSSVGNRIDVDFKFATQPSDGDKFMISCVLFNSGTPQNLDSLAEIQYVKPPVYSTDYTVTLSSTTSNNSGQLKIIIEYSGPASGTGASLYHHNNNGNSIPRHITNYSLNVIKHSGSGISVYSERFAASDATPDGGDPTGYDKSTGLVPVTGTNKYEYYVPNTGNSPLTLAVGDQCEVSLYAENAGGQTTSVDSSTVTISNNPNGLTTTSVERHQVRKHGSGNDSDFGDYTLEPKLVVNLHSNDIGDGSINAITKVKFTIEKYNTTDTSGSPTLTASKYFDATNASTQITQINEANTDGPPTNDSKVVSFTLKNEGSNPNEIPTGFLQKGYHYKVKVLANNKQGSDTLAESTYDGTQTTALDTSVDSGGALYTNGHIRKAHLVSDGASRTLTTLPSDGMWEHYHNDDHKKYRSASTNVSMEAYIDAQLGHKETTSAADLLSYLTVKFWYGAGLTSFETVVDNGTVQSNCTATLDVLTLDGNSQDNKFILTATADTTLITSVQEEIKLEIIYNGAAHEVTNEEVTGSETDITTTYSGLTGYNVPSHTTVDDAGSTTVSQLARNSFNFTREFFTGQASYSLNLGTSAEDGSVQVSGLEVGTRSSNTINYNVVNSTSSAGNVPSYASNVKFTFASESPVTISSSALTATYDGSFDLANAHSGVAMSLIVTGTYTHEIGAESTEVELARIDNLMFHVPEAFTINNSGAYIANGYAIDEIWNISTDGSTVTHVKQSGQALSTAMQTAGYSLTNSQFDKTGGFSNAGLYIISTVPVVTGSPTRPYGAVMPSPVRTMNEPSMVTV